MAMDIYPSDDKGYIKHMIHHHQVAVDMSEHLLKYTRDPRMISLCRDIIWLQKYEIWQMRNMLQSKPYVSPLLIPRKKIYQDPPTLQMYYPDRSSYGEEKSKTTSKTCNYIYDKSIENMDHKEENLEPIKKEHFSNPIVDRSDFFPTDDNPQEQIETFVNDGYYPNNPPLDAPLRNANRQVRSEPQNLQELPSHWNETTIQPEIYRRPLEIDQNCL